MWIHFLDFANGQYRYTAVPLFTSLIKVTSQNIQTDVQHLFNGRKHIICQFFGEPFVKNIFNQILNYECNAIFMGFCGAITKSFIFGYVFSFKLFFSNVLVSVPHF